MAKGRLFALAEQHEDAVIWVGGRANLRRVKDAQIRGFQPEALRERFQVWERGQIVSSAADQLPPGMPLIRQRPFRAPHHTISHAGLVGGGNIPHPGEISLAHRGILFLDEFLEFGTRVLEVMRQPMADKVVTISRAQGSLTFSANFQLVSATNGCPCGWHNDPIKPCTCAPSAVTKYQKRLSGPLLDRKAPLFVGC